MPKTRAVIAQSIQPSPQATQSHLQSMSEKDRGRYTATFGFNDPVTQIPIRTMNEVVQGLATRNAPWL